MTVSQEPYCTPPRRKSICDSPEQGNHIDDDPLRYMSRLTDAHNLLAAACRQGNILREEEIPRIPLKFNPFASNTTIAAGSAGSAPSAKVAEKR